MASLWAEQSATDASDAFLEELVALLDAAPVDVDNDATSVDSRSDGSASSPKTTAPRRARSIGGSAHLKRSLDGLREEARVLSEEVERLREEAQETHSAAMETAMVERHKRRRAEQACQQLRDAVLQNRRFIYGLRSVFSMPPSLASGLNMCQFLHNYTRLPRDRARRWREYAAMAQESRLRSAMEILQRETESIVCSDSLETLIPSVHTPYIRTEFLPDIGGFSVTTTSVYAVDTLDIGAVLRGVCVASCDIVVACPAYKCLDFKRTIVDPDVPTSDDGQPMLQYRVLATQQRGIHNEEDKLAMQARSITLCKQKEDCAVVIWDFVDEDELHPIQDDSNLTRQAVGACLIRRELCRDGVERTVYRAISTRRYRYNDHATPQSARHFVIDSEKRMRTNELLFRGIVVEQVAKEQAAYSRVIDQLETQSQK